MLVATAAAAAAQWQQQRSGSSSTYDRQNNVGKTMNYALGNKFRDAKLDHAVSARRGEGRKPKGEGGGGQWWPKPSSKSHINGQSSMWPSCWPTGKGQAERGLPRGRQRGREVVQSDGRGIEKVWRWQFANRRADNNNKFNVANCVRCS